MNLVELWRKARLESPPYILEEDEDVLLPLLRKSATAYGSLLEYTQSREFGEPGSTSLHLGLLPKPYYGNLEHADVFLLMLNPGMSAGDYYAEGAANADFRQMLLRTIRQQNANDKFPFAWLDPQLAWHGGFDYFHGKFAKVAAAIAPKLGSYSEALQLLSLHVACLQLMPYQSKSFDAHPLLGKLCSTRAMLEFVRGELLSRAKSDRATIIVMRGVRYWDLCEQPNVILYQSGETRGAHLTAEAVEQIMLRLGV